MQGLIDRVNIEFFKSSGYNYLKSETHKPGFSFSLNNDLGQGSYWVYPVNDWFAVISYNTQYKIKFTSKVYNPIAMGLGLTCASNAKDWFGGHNCKQQMFAVCGDDSMVELQVKPGDYVNAKGIVLLPEYYKKRIEPIAGQTFEDFNHMLSNIVSSGQDLPNFRQWIDSLLGLPYDSSYIDLVLEGKILSIVGMMLIYSEIIKNKKIGQRAKSDFNQLNLVLSFIDEHYNENIRLEELLQLACMSKSKLLNLFKDKQGMTITSYIQQQRIGRAKKLLVTTDLPLGLISKQIGYTCHSSFTEVFKTREGMTPRQFRKAFLLANTDLK